MGQHLYIQPSNLETPAVGIKMKFKTWHSGYAPVVHWYSDPQSTKLSGHIIKYGIVLNSRDW